MKTTRDRLGPKKQNFKSQKPKRLEKLQTKLKSQKSLSQSIEILGLDQKTNLVNFVQYLKSLAPVNVEVLETKWIQKNLKVRLGDHIQATSIINVSKNGQFFFEGAQITIRLGQDAGPSYSIVQFVTDLLKSRYNHETKFLNLQSIRTEPSYPKDFIGFRAHSKHSKFGPVLCKAIQELCPGVETISFEDNELVHLGHLSTLSQRVPNLVNLSLKNNKIHTLNDLQPINGKEFTHLRELLLVGNPLREKEIGKTGSDLTYKSNIKKMFPSLSLLDNEALVGEITFAIEDDKKLPAQVKSGFFDNQETSNAVIPFLESFFTLFDTNRQGLYNFYADNAQFSLSVTKYDQQKHSKDLFKGWSDMNRNLDTLKMAEKRVQRLYQGPDRIIQALSQLPVTVHEIRSPPEKKLFIFDCFQLTQHDKTLLYIHVHGEFKVQSQTKRSFDHTFVLEPAQPGSRSAHANIPVSILNEILVVRPYGSNTAWLNTETIPSNLPNDIILQTYKQQFQLNDPQFHICLEFCKKSGLNFATALDCLNQAGWNPVNAYELFESVKAQIPPSAYQI